MSAPVGSFTRPSTALARQEPSGLGGRVRGLFRSWSRQIGGTPWNEKLEQLKARENEFGVDPFGLDVEFTRAAVAPVLWLYKNYFRVDAHGLENVPAGRVLLIANHSG